MAGEEAYLLHPVFQAQLHLPENSFQDLLLLLLVVLVINDSKLVQGVI